MGIKVLSQILKQSTELGNSRNLFLADRHY